MRSKQDMTLHFVGIGGIGMSGIAEVLLNQGYQITGSDQAESDTTKRLAQLGVRICIGHRAENVRGASVIVVSSAILNSNPEVQEARSLGIPVIPRAEMLGELMRGKTGIAVAGSHGKTTTTSILSTILTVAGLDPTLVIGGKVDSLGGNAKLGQGQYVVAEADESDGSFLHLPATFGVITNIDNDHLDYFGNLQAVEDAFLNFVGKLPFYGLAAVCGEDSGVKRCLHRFTKPVMTYGFSSESSPADWDISAEDVDCQPRSSSFKVFRKDPSTGKRELLGTAVLSFPGKHNVLNALAAISIAIQLEVSFGNICKGLSLFKGVKRRFDILWQDTSKKRVIVDDYAHHPTEIAASLETARNFWPGRIVTVFQPHRYSRTLNCRDGFLSAFHHSDAVLVTDVYSAGEEPIPGVDSESLVNDMKKTAKNPEQVVYSGDLAATQALIGKLLQDGDLLLCLGAGSITRLSSEIVRGLVESENESQ